MVVIRGEDEVPGATRRLEVGTRFGIAADLAEETAKIWNLFRRSAGWAGKLVERDRGGAYHTSLLTGKREYWIYGRVVAGNPKTIPAPQHSTVVEGGGGGEYAQQVA